MDFWIYAVPGLLCARCLLIMVIVAFIIEVRRKLCSENFENTISRCHTWGAWLCLSTANLSRYINVILRHEGSAVFHSSYTKYRTVYGSQEVMKTMSTDGQQVLRWPQNDSQRLCYLCTKIWQACTIEKSKQSGRIIAGIFLQKPVYQLLEIYPIQHT